MQGEATQPMHTMAESRHTRLPWRRANEVVVTTGASAGVGRATARAFARRGARIGLIARDADALRTTCREVESLGGEAVPCVADVARAAELESAAAMIEDRLG